MKSINHKQLKDLIKTAYNKKVALYIWGTFGIGKSSVVKQTAEELEIKFVDVRVSQLEPSDLRGLPKIDDGVTKWLIPNWLPQKDKGILFFDELNLSLPSIQASCYQLILDRQLGDYKLPDGWVVLSAGNRIEDRANVFEIPTPLANRFIHIELNIPSIEDYNDWALLNENDIDTRILSFLNFKPSRLFSFDTKIKDKAIPTPRSWEFCSKLIKDVTDEEELNILVSSAIGEGTAIEFLAFLKLQRKINLQEILKNPEKIKDIKEIDLKYSLLSTFTEHYKKNKDKKTLEKFIEICRYLEAEFSVLLLRFVKAIDSNFFKKEIIRLKGFDELSKNYAKYLI